ncbi:type 1 glutamine amidotransferase family protein [Jeotgalibacillus haloalkalitolerans]|uniref:Type 1 glutamine amidotransferase family protein n=1 Tax=Jeotgalibacillus haloalkalitolerans TaxID=3104292 RepID=A0ABU5KNF3_9BACL|nr:type 1 glutamine amidotransferase family protein [Jeotgalibacillus sp. HH7-29]MDZ5712679.1 type 1 glutamine amidotransferase family protein [Jeotgalibacillus sp. HH7-29]
MKNVLVLVTNGFADWEAAYVTAEVNKPGTGYQVKTIAVDLHPKTSMGGFNVLPDYSLQDFSFDLPFSMLIIPGGTGWKSEQDQRLKQLVQYCVDHQISVAAICDATIFLGKNGFLDHSKHTSNTLPYLKQHAPDYKGEQNYIDAQSVSGDDLITANGSGAVEFSRDILSRLNVLEGEALNRWYDIFKVGFVKG